MMVTTLTMQEWKVPSAVFCRQELEKENLVPVADGSAVNALSMTDVQSNSDRMLVREVFVDCETLTGSQFIVDTCSSSSGVNSHCPVFYSPAKSFLSADVCGPHVWLHPPVAKVEPFVKHYLKRKAQVPAKTSACAVVPAVHSARWRKLLQGMQLLRKYPKGFTMFAEAGQGSGQRALGPLPWDYEVYYDPPCEGPAALCEMSLIGGAGQLGMTYMIAFGEWYIRHGAPAFVPRIKIIMEELAGMPETTMGSYWPKISRLTQYVVRQRIVTEAERDARIAANEENPRSHGAELQQPYDKIINSTDYLEFINAVEHGHISLRLTAQELAEMRTAGSDVYLDANGHDEAVEKLTLIGSNEFVHKPLGNSNMKQWGSAAGHLQQV
ncbi:TPA: hypothetical protein ACH3X2_14246 [Trebouxia sp. C0005]